MFRKTFQILQIYLILAAIFLLYQFIHMGWIGYISDSEIWIVNLSKNFSSEWYFPWVITRPLFYGTLALFTAHAKDAISIFDSAKIAGILNGVLIVFFTYRLALFLTDKTSATKKITALLSITLLLTNLGFLNQGYRIRSDLFACTLLLFVLQKTLKNEKTAGLKTFSLWVLPLFCTPKAALNSIAFLVFPPTKKQLLIALEIFVIAVISIILIYPQGLEYFVDLFLTNKDQPTVTISVGFYFWRLIRNNALFFILVLLRTSLLIARINRNAFSSDDTRRKQIKFGAFTGISVLVMCIMPDKVPFFLATFLPILSVFSAFLVEDIFAIFDKEVISERKKRNYKKFLISSVYIFSFALILKSQDEKSSLIIVNNKFTQYSAIKIIENYLNNFPKANYYDVIGIIPQRATIRRFAGPHDEKNNLLTAEWIKNNPPNLLFYVQKFFFIEPTISELISKKYFLIGSKAYARWDYLKKPIPINQKNIKLIRSEIQSEFESVGTIQRDKFSALIELKNKKTVQVEKSEKEFIAELKKYKNSQLLAISPFVSFTTKPGAINNIFKFDIGY